MRLPHTLRVASIAFAVSTATPGLAEERAINAKLSTVTVRVFASGPLGASADHLAIRAPLLEGSLGEPGAPHLQLSLDARQMRVTEPRLSARDREEIQTRMFGPEVLDVEGSPWISYHSVTIESLSQDAWLVWGELGLRSRFRNLAVRVFLKNNRYKGSATIRQSEFGIQPIRFAGGTVTLKDEITVDFDIVAER